MRGLQRVRRYVDRFGRLRLDGYADHGPNWPVFPQWIIMEDRQDGVRYALSHTGTVGVDATLSLTTTLPTENFTDYGPYDGPYVEDGGRLYIEGGTLSADSVSGLLSGRVFTRRALERAYLEITVEDGELVYSDFTDPSYE